VASPFGGHLWVCPAINYFPQGVQPISLPGLVLRRMGAGGTAGSGSPRAEVICEEGGPERGVALRTVLQQMCMVFDILPPMANHSHPRWGRKSVTAHRPMFAARHISTPGARSRTPGARRCGGTSMLCCVCLCLCLCVSVCVCVVSVSVSCEARGGLHRLDSVTAHRPMFAARHIVRSPRWPTPPRFAWPGCTTWPLHQLPR
jgi:hypothetical protein